MRSRPIHALSSANKLQPLKRSQGTSRSNIPSIGVPEDPQKEYLEEQHLIEMKGGQTQPAVGAINTA